MCIHHKGNPINGSLFFLKAFGQCNDAYYLYTDRRQFRFFKNKFLFVFDCRKQMNTQFKNKQKNFSFMWTWHVVINFCRGFTLFQLVVCIYECRRKWRTMIVDCQTNSSRTNKPNRKCDRNNC